MSEVEEQIAGGVVFKQISRKIFICVIHRAKYNDWTLPKGLIKNQESPELASLRTVERETNNNVKMVELLGQSNMTEIEQAKTQLVSPAKMLWYLMESVEETSKPLRSEADQVRWVPIDGDFSLLSYENDRDIVTKAIIKIKSKFI